VNNALFYDIYFKPAYKNQLLALPSAVEPLIRKKVELLQFDPTPDAKNKKKLKGCKGNVCRIRAGKYRIVYTYGDGRVSLMGVEHRKDVYDGDKWDDDEDDIELSGSQPIEPSKVPRSIRRTSARDHRDSDHFDDAALRAQAANNLPRALDSEFLTRIQVPESYHRHLTRCHTLDDLISVNIPEEFRDRIFNTLVTPNYDQVLTQADYRVDSIDDFRRMFEGELVPMLLRLDPEQERHVNWALNGSGPVLLKGAPGTGKSVVAIYRVRSLINALRRSGIAEPRILFTSYTNSLVTSARQMLEALLGADAALVEVSTADMVVSRLHADNGRTYKPVDPGRRRTHVYEAWKQLGQEQLHAIRNLSIEYLIEEIDRVIIAHDLGDELDYLTVPRPGRRIGLPEAQRSAVWRLYELSEEQACSRRQHTYEQARRDALHGVRSGWIAERYDGVVIDEAQDLNPTVIRLLLELAKSPDRLFLTADSNQCIYGNGFRWTDVHHDLQVQGRTSVLRRNFRSTQQIVDAASAFLHGAEIDDDETDESTTHARSGPIPVALTITADDEIDALAGYLREATRTLQVGLASCAVLVGTRNAGKQLALRLCDAGIPAAFMTGKELDLGRPVVKVTTFQSAKGLEFPVVAVAGLSEAPQLQEPDEVSPQDEESRMIARRVLYVAMTRAMYALLVLLPDRLESPTVQRFSDAHWQHQRPVSWASWLESVTAIEPDTALAAAD